MFTSDYSTPNTTKTWFFEDKGTCRGWIRGKYLTDSESDKMTWYLDEKSHVTVLDEVLHPTLRMQFILHEGQVIPEKLFPDLYLGFFWQGNEMILARWK